MSLKVGVGVSEELDEPVEAVAEALGMARSALGDATPVVVLAFASFEFEMDALIPALKAELGDVPFIGCTTDGEITTQGTHLDSLSIMILGGDGVRAQVGVVERVSAEDALERSIAEISRMKEVLGGGKLLLALPDCSGNGKFDSVLDGIKQVMGTNFPIFGGAPSERAKMKGLTWQMINGAQLTDSCPMVLLDGEFKVAHGLRSGVMPIGQTAVVNKTQGNLVFEIDHQPAIEHHKAYLGDITQAATIAQFPYLIPSSSTDGHEYYVTIPIFTWIPENGVIVSTVPVPQGVAVKLGRCTRENILNGARQAAREIREQLGGEKPQALLCFSCSGRKQLLGLELPKEFEYVKEELGEDIPTLGFYCYGELGPLGAESERLKESRVHGYTLSMVALA